jgi:hypothetical protein
MRRVILILALFISGCAPTLVCDPPPRFAGNAGAGKQTMLGRLAEIEHKHGVVIEIKPPLLFAKQNRGVCELLGIIDKDLEICPPYFKDNIGPILIEKSFDELGFEGMFLVGYVNVADTQRDYPIHIKNRSLLEKILLPVPRENNVFLHEASHSFELNIKDDNSDKWEAFYKEFDGVQAEDYSETVFLSQTSLTELSRPASMPGFNSGVNHFEDFAETHCYLRRNNIELIKDKDPTLYRKCKIVERFTDPYGTAAKAGSLNNQSSEPADGGFTPSL